MLDRDNAVASAKSTRTALASVLVTAPAPLRDQLRHIPPERRFAELITAPVRPGGRSSARGVPAARR